MPIKNSNKTIPNRQIHLVGAGIALLAGAAYFFRDSDNELSIDFKD